MTAARGALSPRPHTRVLSEPTPAWPAPPSSTSGVEVGAAIFEALTAGPRDLVADRVAKLLLATVEEVEASPLRFSPRLGEAALTLSRTIAYLDWLGSVSDLVHELATSDRGRRVLVGLDLLIRRLGAAEAREAWERGLVR